MPVFQRLQTLHIAGQRRSNIADGIGRIPLQLALNLASFVTAGQPHQRCQQRRDQHDQKAP